MMNKLMMQAARGHLQEHRRKGIFFVLAIVSLLGAMTFVGMSVDLGMITVTKTRMQSAADAAALGASQEIVVAIRQAGEQGINELDAVHQFAAAAARNVAEDIALQNGFTITPAIDVTLGNRRLAEDGVNYTETWDVPPFNMVKVEIRKTNPDLDAPDGRLPLIFAPVTGERSHSLTADAIAFIDSRDLVTVLDYSGSMAWDSRFRQETVARLGIPAIEDNLSEMWDELVASNVRFSDDLVTPKFPANGFGRINSDRGTFVSSTNTDTIFQQLELDEQQGEGVRFYDWDNFTIFMIELGPGVYNLNDLPGNIDDDINAFTVPQGYTVTLWDFPNEGGWRSGPHSSDVASLGAFNNDAEWVVITGPPVQTTPYVPFPQEGKNSDGTLKGMPSEEESEALWKDYINYVRTDSEINRGGYQRRYGYRSLMHYLIHRREHNHESEDLWRVPIYPHYAMKEGVTQLAGFLDSLGFNDHLGLVTYATTARIETGLDAFGNDTTVNLSGKHLTPEVLQIDTIQRHKQPSHYDSSTAIGLGLEQAQDLLESQSRGAAQKAILLMTDGQSNQVPSDFDANDLPPDWDWNLLTDFDGNGNADLIIDQNYNSGGNGNGNWQAALHAFVQAREAYEAGYTIHTISMGDGADTVLMSAIAQLTGGEYVHIASNTSTAVMEAQLEAAFNVIAGQVPPSRLLVDGD